MLKVFINLQYVYNISYILNIYYFLYPVPQSLGVYIVESISFKRVVYKKENKNALFGLLS